uniref:Uncharacterized protein n=1 Tax=Rhizophora mucronata TaxID=61149 RepID=A0A2P2QGH0_RHIMU
MSPKFKCTLLADFSVFFTLKTCQIMTLTLGSLITLGSLPAIEIFS